MSEPIKLKLSRVSLPVGIPLMRKSVVIDGYREFSIYLTPEQIATAFEHNNKLIDELRADLETARDELRLLKAKLNPPKFQTCIPTSDPHRAGGYGD